MAGDYDNKTHVIEALLFQVLNVVSEESRDDVANRPFVLEAAE
jgi:hypothetical protein